MEDLIKEAIEIGSKSKYIVYIDEIPEEMTYIQLGTYLISNQENINFIKINLKNFEEKKEVKEIYQTVHEAFKFLEKDFKKDLKK